MNASMTLNSTNPSSLHQSAINAPSPSGFKPGQAKPWAMAKPHSPRGDRPPGSSKMPQMQGHHEFNPIEASSLMIAEESPSFYH